MGTQSGIKNVPEGLGAPHGMVATEYAELGADWLVEATTYGRMMWRIRNCEGSKRGGEIRHPAGGRMARTNRFT